MLHRSVFWTLSKIYDERFCENIRLLLEVNYFRKKFRNNKCLTGFQKSLYYILHIM